MKEGCRFLDVKRNANVAPSLFTCLVGSGRDTVRTVLPLALFPQIGKVAGSGVQGTTAHKGYTDFVKLA